MHKAATINARIEPEVKTKAELILHKIGLSPAEAIRLFYKQICLNKGLPFPIKIPNKVTQKAMQKAMHEADTGKTHKAKNVEDLFKDLD